MSGQPGIIWAGHAISHSVFSHGILQGQSRVPCALLYPVGELQSEALVPCGARESWSKALRQLLHVLGLGFDLDLFRKQIEAGCVEQISARTSKNRKCCHSRSLPVCYTLWHRA